MVLIRVTWWGKGKIDPPPSPRSGQRQAAGHEESRLAALRPVPALARAAAFRSRRVLAPRTHQQGPT